MGVDHDMIIFRSVAKTPVTQINLQIGGGGTYLNEELLLKCISYLLLQWEEEMS